MMVIKEENLLIRIVKQFGVKEGDFFACGLSLVLHPKNPFVPTVHANWRYFEMYDEAGNIVTQWFGGGQDLTPYYLFDEDAIHFHTVCRNACDKHHPEFYPKFKETCDNYFWNTHRNEALFTWSRKQIKVKRQCWTGRQSLGYWIRD